MAEVASRRGLIGLAAGPLLGGVTLPYLAAVDDMTRGDAPLPAYVFALGAATLWWSARRPAPRAVLAAKTGALVLVLLVLSAGWAAGLDDAVLPLVPLLAGAAAGCVAGGTLARGCTSRRGLAVWSAGAASAAFLLARPVGPGPASGEAVLAVGTALLVAAVAAVLALLAAPRLHSSPASAPTPAPEGSSPTPEGSRPAPQGSSPAPEGSSAPGEPADGRPGPDSASRESAPGEPAGGRPGLDSASRESAASGAGDDDRPVSVSLPRVAAASDEPAGGPPVVLRAGERAAFGLVVFAAFALGLFAGPGGTYGADPLVALAMLCGLGVAAILVGIAPDRRGAVYAAAAAPAVVALGWGGAESAMRVADGVPAVGGAESAMRVADGVPALLIGVVAVLVGTIAAARLPERPRTLAMAGSGLVALAAVWWVWQPAWAGPEAYLGGAGLGGGLLLGALLRLRRPLAVGVLAIAVCAAPVGTVAAATLGGGPTPPGAQTLGGSRFGGSSSGGLGETHARIVPQPGPSGGYPGEGAYGDGAHGGAAYGDGANGEGSGTAAPRLGEELPYGGGLPSGGSSSAPVEPCANQEERNGEIVCVERVPPENTAIVIRAEVPLVASESARPTGLLVVLAILAGGAALTLARRRPRPGSTRTSPSDGGASPRDGGASPGDGGASLGGGAQGR